MIYIINVSVGQLNYEISFSKHAILLLIIIAIFFIIVTAIISERLTKIKFLSIFVCLLWLLWRHRCGCKNTSGVLLCQSAELINAMSNMADIFSLNQLLWIKEIPHSIPHHLSDQGLGACLRVVSASLFFVLDIFHWNWVEDNGSHKLGKNCSIPGNNKKFSF